MNFRNHVFTRKFGIVFTVGVFATLLSKGLALIPGYGLDDFQLVQAPLTTEDVPFFLARGRYTQAIIELLLARLHLTSVGISWVSVLLLLVIFSFVVSASAFFVTRGKGNVWVLGAAVALIVAHPYSTEYFTFRQATISLSIAFALLGLAIVTTWKLYESERRSAIFYFLVTALLLLLATGIMQSILIVYGVIVLAKLFYELSIGPRLKIHQLASLLAFVSTGVIYFFLLRLSVNFSGIPPEPRAELIQSSEWRERFFTVFDQLVTILFRAEPVLGRDLKVFSVVLFVLLLVIVAVRTPLRAVYAVLFTLLSTVLGLFLVAIPAVWWPVPRAVFPLSFIPGLLFIMLVAGISKRLSFLFAGLVALVALGLSLNSATILNDQHRLNVWDLNTARSITERISALGIESDKKIILVGAPWGYPVGLSTIQGDLNNSALSVNFSSPGLFSEATGQKWLVENRESSPVCSGAGVWPSKSSVVFSDGVVFVCFK